MTIIICSGIHPPGLTLSFIEAMGAAGVNLDDREIVPIHLNPPLFPPAFALWLCLHYPPAVPVKIIAFSAGVVGAIAGANLRRASGGEVGAFIAVDGWGAPLFGDFPLYRVSHDRFTHITGSLLGAGECDFYAEPPVTHLHLWARPPDARGWSVTPRGRTYTNAAAFLARLL